MADPIVSPDFARELGGILNEQMSVNIAILRALVAIQNGNLSPEELRGLADRMTELIQKNMNFIGLLNGVRDGD